MAQTGMNYTKAALELERQEAAEKMNAATSKEDVADDSVMSMLARAYESMERPTRPTGLPDADQLREIMQRATGLPDADQLREIMQRATGLPDADQLREIMQRATGLPDADQLREIMQRATAFAIRFTPPA
jgi:hypothetical protein